MSDKKHRLWSWWCVLAYSSWLINALALSGIVVIPSSSDSGGNAPILAAEGAITTEGNEMRDIQTRLIGETPLRIMPLGASITFGVGSSDGNGYRKPLRDMLVLAAAADGRAAVIDMVGSVSVGTMADDQNEGWPGFIIDEVRAKARTSVPSLRPNLILINAGTNDCLRDIDIPNAGQRMRAMIEDLFTMSPGTTVILSTLLVNGDVATQQRVVIYNTQLKALAAAFQNSGRSLVLVDMQGPEGPTAAELVDGTHPGDAGYVKMANIWLGGIREADRRNFIKQPS